MHACVSYTCTTLPPILTQIQEAKRSIKHWKIQVNRTKPGSMGGGTIYIYIYIFIYTNICGSPESEVLCLVRGGGMLRQFEAYQRNKEAGRDEGAWELEDLGRTSATTAI